MVDYNEVCGREQQIGSVTMVAAAGPGARECKDSAVGIRGSGCSQESQRDCRDEKGAAGDAEELHAQTLRSVAGAMHRTGERHPQTLKYFGTGMWKFRIPLL